MVQLYCWTKTGKLVTQKSFRTRYIWFPSSNRKNSFFSDSVNFTRVIENGEQYVNCNGICAYCVGNTVCCKLHSDRREKRTEW
jgi:hypothetical protein